MPPSGRQPEATRSAGGASLVFLFERLCEFVLQVLSMKFWTSVKQNLSWIFSGLGVLVVERIDTYYKGSPWSIISLVLRIAAVLMVIVLLKQACLFFFKKRDSGAYIKGKIREVFHFLLNDRETCVANPYRYDCYEVHETYKNLCFLIKDAICDNQGVFADYHFNGGRLHKRIKDEFRSQQTTAVDALKKHCDELNAYLSDKLYAAIRMNHDYLVKYFSGRSEHDPRIIIKGFREGNIVDIFRLKHEYYTKYGVETNKGFASVYENGMFYVCNDIPEESAKDAYYNPRLINRKVRTHLEDIRKVKKGEDNERWIDCWVQHEYTEANKMARPSPESCYKSTLIVPMTLLNNEGLSDEFRKHFKIPRPSADANLERAIYGFLCFDHREINYFRNPLDVKIGYIFADLISLYLIERLNYTEYSSTFDDALAATSNAELGGKHVER